MKRWEIYDANIPIGKTHPVVLFSPNHVCESPSIKLVNVLLCSSVKSNQPLASSEVALDEADGLDHLTGCQCHMVWHVSKDRLTTLRGSVTAERRAEIKRKVREAFDL